MLYNTGMETQSTTENWKTLPDADLLALVCRLQDEKPVPTPVELDEQVAMWRELKTRSQAR